MLWLAIFFVVPIASLFLTSLQTPVPGGQVGEFEQTFNFANYVNTLTDDTYYVPLIRSFVSLRHSNPAGPGHRLSPGLRDRVQVRQEPQPSAGHGDRAVLRVLHPAHDRLAADSGRRGFRGRHIAIHRFGQ